MSVIVSAERAEVKAKEKPEKKEEAEAPKAKSTRKKS